MEFSTEAIEQMTQILVTEFQRQLEAGEAVPFTALEHALRGALQEAGCASLGRMLSQQDEQAHGPTRRCECQQVASRIARRSAQLLSVFGWLEYRRSYYHCGACQRRWFPLDEQPGLRPGRATPGMGRLLGMAGVTVSFEEACRQIGEYLLVEVSVNTVRKETQLLGERQQQREAEWVQHSQDLAYLQARERNPERPQRGYGSIDGAFVPIGTTWKEQKTVSWYRAGQRYGSPELHAQDITYYTSLEGAAPFGDLVWASAVHHQVDQAAEVVFVCDGAAWIWKLVTHYFPQAVQIVDWYHACQYLYRLAEALFASDSEPGQAWLQTMLDRLWEGQITHLIYTCQQLVQENKARPEAQAALTYYTNNQTRMDYAHFRTQGYFIGSGPVESACKQIVALRLRRAGARWTQAGASATAKARAAWLSNQWEELTALPLAV